MTSLAEQLEAAVRREDGIAASRLLSITKSDISKLAYSSNEALIEHDVKKGCSNPAWANIAVAHWRVAYHVARLQDLVAAYKAQNELLVNVNRAAERCDNWVLPVMSTVARELRQLSIFADNAIGKQGKEDVIKSKKELHASLEEAARTINRSFTLCLNDRNSDLQCSKKWGIYFFLGELFKMYFKLRNPSLARNAIKVIKAQQSEVPPLEEYPKSHSVTYLYYWGVILFIAENYQEALTVLERAWNLCHKSSRANQELILLYLIPVKFLVDKKYPSAEYVWPSNTKTKKYPRLEAAYKDLFRSCRRGDIKAFDKHLRLRRDFFVHKSLYLSMQRFRLICCRSALYRTYTLLGNPTRVSVGQFTNALQFAGYFSDDTDLADETECLVAVLISKGLIKGYISHERQTIVLSNKDAFP